MIKTIEDFLDKTFDNRDVLFLSSAVFIFSLFRLPSVIEPYWYGDEGVYEVVGAALRSGRILYSQIWDNKPPLLYVIYAVFNGDQFYVRLASLVAGLLSVLVFFAVAKKLFKNRFSVYFSTFFFAIMFGLPVLEGNIANAENFMILPTLISFYLLFCLERKNKFLITALAGIILSVSFLTKIVALFDFAAFGASLLALRFFERVSFKRADIIREIKSLIIGLEQEVILGIFFAIPVLLTVVYFISKNAFSDFFRAAFSQNVGYVAYGNYFLFPNGLLYLKLFLLIASVLIAFRWRRILGHSGLIIFIWLFLSLFSAFFSARPYTHYLLVLLPSFALLTGFVFEKNNLWKVTVPILLIILFFVNQNFKFYAKIIPYYGNYFSFITGGSVTPYRSFFDSNVPRDYDLASFINIKTAKNEGVFLWGDDPQIYALSGKLPPGRYTVSYHITFYKNAIDETRLAILKNPPRYIIQIKNDNVINNFLAGYELRYIIDNVKIYEKQS